MMSFDEHDLGVASELSRLATQVQHLTEEQHSSERATQSMIQASEAQARAGQVSLESRLSEIGRQLGTSHEVLEKHLSESKVAWKTFRDDIDEAKKGIADLRTHVDGQITALRGEIDARVPVRPFHTVWQITKGLFGVVGAGAAIVGAAWGLHGLHWLGF